MELFHICVPACVVTKVMSDSVDPMDCSLPGFSVQRFFQGRILEWVAISFSRGSSGPRDWTHTSFTGRWVLYHWAIREAQSFEKQVTSETSQWLHTAEQMVSQIVLSFFLFTLISGPSWLAPLLHQCSFYKPELLLLFVPMLFLCLEGGNRTGSILKAGLCLGPDCGLWALGLVSMETNYQLENQAPRMEEPHGSYLDSPSPKRIP